MTNCLEPDKMDEMWPPEIAVCRASEELYAKAYSIEAPQIDLRYVMQAAETLRLVVERLRWKVVTSMTIDHDIGW